VAGVTVAMIPLADTGASAALYVQLGLGMLLFQFAIGATNDSIDHLADAAEKAWKPIPSGAVDRRAADSVALGCAAAGLLLTFSLDLGAWLIGVAGLSCGLAYDFWLKRTALSWLPLSLALPLIPAWVYVSTGTWDPLLWWAFPLGAMLGLAVHLANQLPDATRDGAAGLPALAPLLGPRRAALAAYGLFGIALSSAAVVLAFEDSVRAGLVAATGAVAGVLIPRAGRLFGRDGVFGVVAVSAAVAGLVFVSAA
jgi:4-hydroxybenzoate polyprenyltransferase